MDQPSTKKEETVQPLPSNDQGNSADASVELSKRQKRKLEKTAKWLERLPEKRKHEREKKKEKKRLQREAGIFEKKPSRKRMKQNKMTDSSCKIKVVIDCSFDNLMDQKDICRLGQQIQFAYSSNRRAENPLQFYVTGLNSVSKTRERLESVGDYQGWDVHFKSESYLDVFGKSNVVYLSAESSNVLNELQEDKAYIIGGLVDHNKHKGVCFKQAEEIGIQHAQLPIGQYMQLKTRKVLTVNHVFDILLNYTESGDWRKAFCDIIPQRKGGMAIEADSLKVTSDHNNMDKVEDEKTLNDNKNDIDDSCTSVDAEYSDAQLTKINEDTRVDETKKSIADGS